MISSKLFNPRNAVLASLLAASALLVACGDDATGPGESNAWPSDKKVHIISPVGGATVHVGDVVDIRWEVSTPKGETDTRVDAADVELSPDNGKNWGYYLNTTGSIRPTDPNWEDFKWTVPASVSKGGGADIPLAGNSQVLVRVLQYSTADDSLTYALPKPLTVLAKP
jgi:hypothetical protein